MKIKITTRLFHITKALICFLLLFASSVYAQDPPQYGTPFAGVPDTRDINMYQVHIRPFSASGNLAGVTARLDNIKALGTNVIYLMPIFPHGTDSRSSASPYCIKDFKAVGSEYGSLADLRTLVDGAHSRGMAVILDIAINGTSWDHGWTVSHPEYYKRTGTTIQQLGNFSDIAALDLNNSATRNAIKDAMRYWIFAANIDGYRCDYANNPPLDFWSEVNSNLRSISSHNLLMLAEGDRQENFQVGFDMNYGDRWFHSGLYDIANGGPVSQRLQDQSTYEYAKATGNQQIVRYTGNHDTYTNDDGVRRPFVVFKNHNGIVANFLVSAYMKGVPFLMSGQEIDYEPKTDWPWTNFKFNWSQNPTAAADFAKILNFRTASAAIRRGDLTTYANDDISIFTKTLGSEKVIVMSNLRNASKSYVIPAALAGTYVNPYNNNASVTLTAGSTRNFAAFEYLVLTNTNAPAVAVTGVSVSPATATVGLGTTQQLNAAIAPANATNQNVTWTSSNTAVATVNASGLVTAVAAGTAAITVKTVDGNKTATSAITVAAIPVSSAAVSPASASLYAGNTQQLSVTISPANATNKNVTWSSSNSAVATVNSSGLVTAVSAGTVTITATTQDGNKTASAAITVNPNTNFTVYFYKPSNWGTGIKIYYWNALPTGVLANATWPGVNMTDSGNGWYSYTFTNVNSTNLIFNDGTNQTADLSRNKTGWYMNSTWYDSNPGTGIAVTSVSLSPSSASLNAGGTQQLTPTVLPANATNKSVTYSSNNTAVATVNSSGLITAVANGTATITVSTVDGNKTSTCIVTVSTTSGGGNYYTIKNRWTGAYLSDAGTNTGYGTTVSGNNYKWQKIAIDATYFVLKNVATGELMNIEGQTGSVQCNITDTTFWSAQWSSDYIDGTWVRLRNRWQTGNIIHVENQTGSAQYGNSQDGWYSAQWQLEPTTVGTGKSALKIDAVSETEQVISIYPNPSVNNEFNVVLPELESGDMASISVSDINGRTVLTERLSSSGKIDHRLASGIYIVNIVSKEYKTTKKLIVK
ncbi:Ig-like domain-containing protein [Flavobacterium johnsoniae]|uniref:Candidate alpha glycosidase Glycoside hydrolase family 13 n=1 Tax=Flavobacterium johnsoniae (strain ATCC 17061 / DSM 2064 / JCM 8514 / BCRC 14874 / CCUG 350202 / NBRC 14942 / NCIMB 11054 / UW101) TaxID=376686 RepID=A5FKN4_FLAJ1|nr:Ig-like domain-containing protein [Flavobacterium johnsoniae]ABQ04240.2 Candidate alpha glycosidase; Glycoside hydrolase family 13 [Flavobacterium johnsoniae UW101]WQG83965.1 Ig-like domain-containing protein [Flavobacterium johnsoniae UW101]SHK16672.1 Por secretion system C-terminal sorting domain-containing protein [Flavobacterium johnsoniae]